MYTSTHLRYVVGGQAASIGFQLGLYSTTKNSGTRCFTRPEAPRGATYRAPRGALAIWCPPGYLGSFAPVIGGKVH